MQAVHFLACTILQETRWLEERRKKRKTELKKLLFTHEPSLLTIASVTLSCACVVTITLATRFSICSNR